MEESTVWGEFFVMNGNSYHFAPSRLARGSKRLCTTAVGNNVCKHRYEKNCRVLAHTAGQSLGYAIETTDRPYQQCCATAHPVMQMQYLFKNIPRK